MNHIICNKIGIRYPIIQGPMAWASDSRLAASVSNAGGLGIMGLGFCPPEVVETEIQSAKSLTSAPFGLNIITCLPDAKKLLEITLKENIRVVELETFPDFYHTLKEYTQALHANGVTVIGKVASVEEASVYEAAGVDFVAVKGCDGGGHIFGFTGTFTLIPQVVDAVSIPVINSSGVADGRGVAASLMLGAAGVEVGSRFLLAQECPIHDNYKNAIIAAQEGDTVLTGVMACDGVRGISNPLTDEMLRVERELPPEEAAEKIREMGRGVLRQAAVEGDVTHGSLVVGQNLGLLNQIEPASVIMEDLIGGYLRVAAATQH
ncbi:Nitronate monooxygenase [Vibrio aerogenes CECT 7868]|uniref:Nitronate monooxygenase n=1 Tax=Vibrio aerogenes CECT 7868 TaxID=1216006 RepID=A0A1M5VK76_9VIBR|nr:nitronate monooxygenase [Vibrio aerogenes]SHH75666.1 Nitronate monooxygenase [Vibrio aerogenes CECT 7868]